MNGSARSEQGARKVGGTAWMAMVILAACALVVVGGAPAWAGQMAVEENPDPDAEALAIEAHQILSDHCAEVEGSSTTLAAQSVTQVSEVWARISAKLEETGKEYLLYWRGVLGQCLNQDERALEDLSSFVEGRKDEDLWASLVLDADTRIRRLEQQALSKGPQVNPRKLIGVIAGALLAGGSVGSAVGSGIRWQQAQDFAEILYASKLSGADRETQIFNGNELARTSHALGGLALGCGIGSAVAFVLAATADAPPKATARLLPPMLVPNPTGAVAIWEGRW